MLKDKQILKCCLPYFKLYGFFWILAFLVYLQGWDAGWNFDAINYAYHAKDRTLYEMLSIHLDISVRYVYHIVQYVLYQTLGYHGMAWYLLKISLHTLLIATIYYFIKNYLFIYKINEATIIAFLISILCLISPYNTEVVLNQVTVHYIYVMLFIFVGLNILLCSLQNQLKINYIVLFIISYTLAVYSLEQAFIFPIIASIILYFYPKQNKLKYWLIFVLVPILLIISYLLLNQYVVHSAIGHYGLDRHFRFGIDRITIIVYKNILDFIAFIEYWRMDYIYKVYDFLGKNYLVLFVVSCLFLSFISYHTLIKKNKFAQLILTVILFFLVSIATTIGLQILSIIPIEDDRYNYLTAPFALLLFLLISYKIDKNIMYVLFFILFGCSILLSMKNARNWQIAQKTIDNTIASFPYQPNKNYIILASSQYVEGCAIWDIKEDEKVSYFDRWQIKEKVLFVKRNIDVFNKVGTILNYNIINVNDCPTVEVINDSTIRMTLPCCGKWWWKKRFGAADEANNLYSIKLTHDWQQEVFITFKQKLKNTIYLYQCGDSYKILNF